MAKRRCVLSTEDGSDGSVTTSRRLFFSSPPPSATDMATPIIFGPKCSHALTTQSRSLRDKTSKKRKRQGEIPMNEILPGTKEWKCKGHTLDAVIFHDNIDRFKHVLQEGNVYMVKGAYVSDPKQYRNPIVTCNYQWTFRKDTSVNEEPNDSIPVGGLSFRTTPSCEFHKFLSTKTLINTACVIIGTHEPRVVTVKGQGKVIREYAAIDTELETFVVTFWETSVSDEIYAKLESISNRTPLLLLNFSVVPYYGLSLTTNAQSIVLDSSENEMLIELERWKQENEEAINMLVQTGGVFEKKVLRSPKQPLQITKVEQMLQNQENTYFNVKVKARLENEYQDYFYIGCPICSTKTVASYGTEFMCYSTPCKNMRIANRSFRFSLMVFDASGQVEVTFLGKEAQKHLGLDPSEFYEKQNQMMLQYHLRKLALNLKFIWSKGC